MPTTADILANAPIACVLAQNDIDKGLAYQPRLDPQLAAKIYATYFVIKKIYDIDPNYDGIYECCLYLWELMGRWGIQAQAYTGGGGSVAPPTYVTTLYPLEFVVSLSSRIPIGGSSVYLPEFRGYNLVFNRNNQPQTMVDNGGSYYTWDKISGLFACIGVANQDELFSITPVI